MKTLDYIRHQRDGERTEFKYPFQSEVIETLVAFANTSGGTVYVGLDDAGQLKGVELGKETIQKWMNEIKIKTQPAIIPTIQVHSIDSVQFVTIEVQEFPVKPLSFKGRYYKRVANSNHQLSALEITEMNLKSLQLSWDSYLKPEKTTDDLSISKIKKFTDRVNSSGRFSLSGDWQKDLEKLRLIKGTNITNAVWLLFSKENTGYNVHLGRFKTPSLIIDDKMVNGTLFEVVEETMNYLIGQIKVAFEITGETTKRNEIFEYPLPALRESVLNAIIHRDYLSPIDIQIKIFDQSITFYNPGSLFRDLTIEKLKKDNYQANTRNKLIAEAFYLTGDIEKYGSGFIRIRNEIKVYPTMKFSVESAPNGLLAVFSYKSQKTSQNTSVQVPEKVAEKVVENLSQNQQKIVDLVRKNRYATALELDSDIGISQRKMQSNVAILKSKGILKRIGSSKKGYWEVIH